MKIAKAAPAGLLRAGRGISGRMPRQIRGAIRELPPEVVADVTAGVPVTGDPEKDQAAKLMALQVGFRERRKREQKRYDRATDGEFWVCVCFKTREQKQQFLREIGMKGNDKYVDGGKLAQLAGVSLHE